MLLYVVTEDPPYGEDNKAIAVFDTAEEAEEFANQEPWRQIFPLVLNGIT